MTSDYEAVVKLSEGFNGADLRNVCTEAGMFAIRDDRDFVTQDDFMKGARKLQEVSLCVCRRLGTRLTTSDPLLRRRSTRVRVITLLCSWLRFVTRLASCRERDIKTSSAVDRLSTRRTSQLARRAPSVSLPPSTNPSPLTTFSPPPLHSSSWLLSAASRRSTQSSSPTPLRTSRSLLPRATSSTGCVLHLPL